MEGFLEDLQDPFTGSAWLRALYTPHEISHLETLYEQGVVDESWPDTHHYPVLAEMLAEQANEWRLTEILDACADTLQEQEELLAQDRLDPTCNELECEQFEREINRQWDVLDNVADQVWDPRVEQTLSVLAPIDPDGQLLVQLSHLIEAKPLAKFRAARKKRRAKRRAKKRGRQRRRKELFSEKEESARKKKERLERERKKKGFLGFVRTDEGKIRRKRTLKKKAEKAAKKEGKFRLKKEREEEKLKKGRPQRPPPSIPIPKVKPLPATTIPPAPSPSALPPAIPAAGPYSEVIEGHLDPYVLFHATLDMPINSVEVAELLNVYALEEDLDHHQWCHDAMQHVRNELQHQQPQEVDGRIRRGLLYAFLLTPGGTNWMIKRVNTTWSSDYLFDVYVAANYLSMRSKDSTRKDRWDRLKLKAQNILEDRDYWEMRKERKQTKK